MKEILPTSPAHEIVESRMKSIRGLFDRYVVPSYGRFEIAFERGEGSWLWDVYGRKYLDLGGGIAVCSLGHAHPEVAAVLAEQSRKLLHVSNLYYQEPQGRLAQEIVRHIAPGKIFFCNSGAEANEGLYKLARKVGHDAGRYEVITAFNSFHGRTLAGISATGQEKVKKGFEPMVDGFRHVPFNDLEALKNAVGPKTGAVLLEGIQGEGGITSATPEYLRGARALCDEHGLLLFMDGVQCGHFRTGSFQSFQRILGDAGGVGDFLPDGISMAKSLGGGFPIGAFWVREKYADVLGPGTHGTTYGGTPLGCAVALRIFEIIQRDRLAENARALGDFFHGGLERIAAEVPGVITAVRGMGLMLGFELAPKEEMPALVSGEKPSSLQVVQRLHDAGVLTIPSGERVVRLLPALNLTQADAEHGLRVIREVIVGLAK